MKNYSMTVHSAPTSICPVCTEDGSLVYDQKQNVLVSHYKDRKGVSNLLIVQQKAGGEESVTIKINFCPWCGRELRNKSNEEN